MRTVVFPLSLVTECNRKDNSSQPLTNQDKRINMSNLRITKIEVHEFTFPMADVGKDYNGFNLVYEKDGMQTGYAMKVHTNEGVTGEYVRGDSPSFAEFNMFAKYLIGKDPLQR
jgi:uncharacterized protein with NRDE domain